MSIGVPIYLVSGCTTGEEFVAAFRRYADRSGLFIPIAEPIAVGKRGRFAVTLTDGAVMVEGEAEVVSSTRTPSVLHGRIGMTLRFGEPDEPSKIVLVELEKARLSMKPPPPSVPPRPADVPAAPRPVPPPAAGRIDASNALAECVAIGDLEALEVAPAAPKPITKFVMPAVAPVPDAQRSRTPSATPLGLRPRHPSTPPVVVPASRPKQPTAPPPASGPVRVPVTSTQPSAVVPPPPPPLPSPFAMPNVRSSATVQMPSVLRPPNPNESIPAFESGVPSAPIVAPAAPLSASGSVPAIEVEEPTDLTEIPSAALLARTAAATGAPPLQTVERAEVRTDRIPRKTVLGIAVVPDGMTVLPAPMTAIAEPTHDTSVTSSPLPPRMAPTIEEPTPSGNWTITPGADKPTLEPRATVAPAAKASATPRGSGSPTGDWSIAVLPESPDGWSEPAKVERRALTVPGPPVSAVASTTDVDTTARPEPAAVAGPTVQIDPSLIEALVEDAVPVPITAPLLVATSNGAFSDTMMAVEPPSEQVSAATAASASGSALRAQLPAHEMAVSASGPVSGPVSGQVSAAMPHVHSPGSGLRLPVMPTPVPSLLANGTHSAYPVMPEGPAQQQMMGFAPAPRAATPRAVTPGESHEGEDSETAFIATGNGSRTRTLVIIASALLAVAVGVVVFVMLSRGRHHAATSVADAGVTRASTVTVPEVGIDAAATPTATVETAIAVADAETAVTTQGDAPIAAVTTTTTPATSPTPPIATPGHPAVAAVAAVDCKTTIETSPAGAELLIDSASVGTTPKQVTLRCGVETKLTLRKFHYTTAVRTIVPKDHGKAVRVKLEKVTFTVKLSSSPPGATVSVGGRSIGVTPTTARLPAFELTSVVFSKAGYTSDTQKLTAKQNNQTLHSQLKKQGK